MANNSMVQLRNVLGSEVIRKQFEGVLKDSAGAFMASIIELYSSDTYLQKCEPNAVIREALKAATLKLPINKGLGFAYIIPYKNVPQMQIGYKGIIQLAQRSGQYKYINADCTYEGETVQYNRISGMLEVAGEAKSDKVIGYFAYFQLLNGFEKAVYWSVDRVKAHAKKFSQAYRSNRTDSPWYTNFDAMAIKTVLKSIITKYGPMSVEFASAMAQDEESGADAEVAANANGTAISIDSEFVPEGDSATPSDEDFELDRAEGPGF